MTIISRNAPIRAWHFLYEGDKLRTGEVAPEDGGWLTVKGPVSLCFHGLHASRQPWQALQHAPGPILCLVDCAGEIEEAPDKLACTDRRIVVRMDATPLLRYFARQQALSVINNYPGNPDPCVLDWLMGDEAAARSARSAARSAAESARSAASAAAWSAASAAAWSAAKSARSAASAAAWSAARSAAESAAWSAAAESDFNDLVYDAFADWL